MAARMFAALFAPTVDILPSGGTGKQIFLSAWFPISMSPLNSCGYQLRSNGIWPSGIHKGGRATGGST